MEGEKYQNIHLPFQQEIFLMNYPRNQNIEITHDKIWAGSNQTFFRFYSKRELISFKIS